MAPSASAGLAVRVGHGLERVLADRDDDRHAHQREDDAAVQDVDADRRAGDASMISWLITVRPMKPQTTLGMAASSSMTIFSVSVTRGAAELGEVDRRAEAERHGEQPSRAP